MNDERLYEWSIPDNVLESKRILGFRPRNWIEGLICAGIIGFIVVNIPFVLRVKLIFLVCLCNTASSAFIAVVSSLCIHALTIARLLPHNCMNAGASDFKSANHFLT